MTSVYLAWTKVIDFSNYCNFISICDINLFSASTSYHNMNIDCCKVSAQQNNPRVLIMMVQPMQESCSSSDFEREGEGVLFFFLFLVGCTVLKLTNCLCTVLSLICYWHSFLCVDNWLHSHRHSCLIILQLGLIYYVLYIHVLSLWLYIMTSLPLTTIFTLCTVLCGLDAFCQTCGAEFGL